MSATQLPPHLKPKARIVSIQVCRGLAALLVVLAHLHNLELKYLGSNRLGALQFGVVGVDLFFVISGVVISAVTYGHSRQVAGALRFLYQRVARIYPIYWIYTLLVLLAFLRSPHLINASAGNRVHIASSFLLIPSDLPMLLLQGWTLSYEMYFYFVFFALLLFCAEKWRLPVLLAWAVLVLAVHFGVHPRQPLPELLSSPLVCEFLFGCILYAVYRRTSLHPAAGVVLLGVAAVWFGVFVRWTAYSHHSDQQWIEYSSLFRPLLYGSFAALFLAGLMELERSGVVSFAGPLAAVGEWSYSMYLSHTIVLKAIFLLFLAYLPRLSIGWIAAASLIAVLVVSCLSFTFVERPLLALLYKPSRGGTTPMPHARGGDVSLSS